jgi:hypothetical protein
MINYSKYLKICRDAVNNEKAFNNFKSNPNYRQILEHVSYEQGLDYIEEITKYNKNLLKDYPEFCNDKVGNPTIHNYKEIGMVSPTTLRYIKVLSDLLKLFKKLKNKNIVEIGGGYGGQCKIIYNYTSPKSYTLIDLPEVLLLSEKYLKQYNISNTIFRNINNISEIKYDLCISNYSFTEIDRRYQDLYTEKIIKNSDCGYITCNFLSQFSNRMNLNEIKALRSDFEILPEVPLTAPDNLIYTWKNGLDYRR